MRLWDGKYYYSANSPKDTISNHVVFKVINDTTLFLIGLSYYGNYKSIGMKRDRRTLAGWLERQAHEISKDKLKRTLLKIKLKHPNFKYINEKEEK